MIKRLSSRKVYLRKCEIAENSGSSKPLNERSKKRGKIKIGMPIGRLIKRWHTKAHEENYLFCEGIENKGSFLLQCEMHQVMMQEKG